MSSTQLDATASVPGAFVYDPASGTVPDPGMQVLSAVFTPTDETDYSMVTATVPLTVTGTGGGTGSTIYQYSLGYYANSNVETMSDLSLNGPLVGSWTYQYDNLNRLESSQGSQPGNSFTNYCWSYDNFGNRGQQMGSDETISGGGSAICTQQSGSNITYAWANYSGNSNQVAATSQAPGGVSTDAAGDVTNDGKNQYLYNANGQICAVEWSYNGMTVMTGYIYDADGQRVAKGTISSMSCDPALSHFTTQTDYVRDQSGNPLSEFTLGSNGAPVLQLTNVWANGMLIATDDSTETHFYLNDWLGTRRVETSYAGAVEQTCTSLPFGDADNCSAGILFTGKERDAESGNDYFGARYYASTMGRFLSPDHPLIDQHPENPQSWNLYAYARNNPLIMIDPNGLGCLFDMGSAGNGQWKVGINNSISSDDCSGQHGTWVPGDINKDDVGVYLNSDGNPMFQVTTNTGGNVYYSTFGSGAQTDEDGTCLNGCQGASIAHAPTDWLSSQIAGGSLDGMMSFAANRFEPRRDGGSMALLAGPGFSPDAPDNWAGPGGMGTPQGQGDWAAMVHDYNFFTNNITIGTYFNPFVSRATAKALIQSDNYLIGHAGGAEAVKMGMFFGVVNAFQWLTHPF